jgi:hypothetical protein
VVQTILSVLLEGYECAEDLRVSPCEFAVEVPTLRALGGTMNTLRWLARRGLAEYVLLPQTRAGTGRRAQHEAYREHPEGPCFILTDRGARVVRGPCPVSASRLCGPPLGLSQEASAAALPVWDTSAGELRYLDQLVKGFRKAISNQRAVLDAFQRLGWPEELEDPLPPPEGGVIHARERLQDTVKNLNRGHHRRLLRFYGTGRGRVVGWKALA